jgi:Flp pilus assembly protein TadG
MIKRLTEGLKRLHNERAFSGVVQGGIFLRKMPLECAPSGYSKCGTAIAWAKRLEDERGAALVELAICVPLLLIMVFGLIDFSQMIFDNQRMSGISRQGSDLASRDAFGSEGLPPIVSALVTQGAAMNIGTQGRIILTEVGGTGTQPTILAQSESLTGITVTSAVGSGVGNPATVPANAVTVLNAGQRLFVTEVFYSYTPMTPVGGLLKTNLASTLYDVAYF